MKTARAESNRLQGQGPFEISDGGRYGRWLGHR